jgi:hypothetical protein
MECLQNKDWKHQGYWEHRGSSLIELPKNWHSNPKLKLISKQRCSMPHNNHQSSTQRLLQLWWIKIGCIYSDGSYQRLKRVVAWKTYRKRIQSWQNSCHLIEIRNLNSTFSCNDLKHDPKDRCVVNLFWPLRFNCGIIIELILLHPCRLKKDNE